MKTLTIKDLAVTEQLDRSAMAGVRGGTKMSVPSYPHGNFTYAPSFDSSITATQNMAQFQTVQNSVADGSALIDNLHVTNKTSMFGQNNIVQH
jgi:hypothetical protein